MSLFYMCLLGEEQNVKRSMLPLMPSSNPGIPTHSNHTPLPLNIMVLPKSALVNAGALMAFCQITDVIITQKLPTEIFIHSSLSVQKFIFFRSVHSKRECFLIYPWISYDL